MSYDLREVHPLHERSGGRRPSARGDALRGDHELVAQLDRSVRRRGLTSRLYGLAAVLQNRCRPSSKSSGLEARRARRLSMARSPDFRGWRRHKACPLHWLAATMHSSTYALRTLRRTSRAFGVVVATRKEQPLNSRILSRRQLAREARRRRAPKKKAIRSAKGCAAYQRPPYQWRGRTELSGLSSASRAKRP